MELSSDQSESKLTLTSRSLFFFLNIIHPKVAEMVRRIESGWNWTEALANATKSGVKVCLFFFPVSYNCSTCSKGAVIAGQLALLKGKR